MSQVKLFGTTIQLPFYAVVSDHPKVSCGDESSCLQDDNKFNTSSATSNSKLDGGPPSISLVDSEPCKSSIGGDSPKTPSQGNEHSSFKSSQKEEQSDTSMSQEKTLKKPDKLLPCPRCKSMDTKFCYFNNYNVNQPRHFCKKCQRYWTAGGTMRNVPVGAGRRKSKNSLKFDQQPLANSLHGCFPAHPWTPVQWGPTMPPQPYMPYWGCAPPGSWPMTWLQTPNTQLGKHTRDQEQHGEEESKKEPKLLVPKTLRPGSINSGGVFGGFRPKGGEISSIPEPSFALQANPAALSRSVMFRENAQ